jgi:hypothetical protein
VRSLVANAGKSQHTKLTEQLNRPIFIILSTVGLGGAEKQFFGKRPLSTVIDSLMFDDSPSLLV